MECLLFHHIESRLLIRDRSFEIRSNRNYGVSGLAESVQSLCVSTVDEGPEFDRNIGSIIEILGKSPRRAKAHPHPVGTRTPALIEWLLT